MRLLKKLILAFFLVVGSLGLKAQKVDSLFFNLYTDSLKKGVHNYINVDGKLSNGQWLPLTEKQLIFSSTYGKFEGNSLIIDTSFKGEKVTIKITLRADTTVSKETTIYIKKLSGNEKLKTVEEVLNGGSPKRRNRNK
jgi:hypothetical protein